MKTPVALVDARVDHITDVEPNVDFLSVPPSAFKFTPGSSRKCDTGFPLEVDSVAGGDKRPTMHNGKMFRFVPHPSAEHFKKMDATRELDCTLLKYVRVPAPGYGIVLTILTLGSLDRKELYEVLISNFPFCSCKDFKYMSTWAFGNKKHKWMSCKHLYFLLQKHFSCIHEDVFIHCLGWIPNEVKLLIGRAS